MSQAGIPFSVQAVLICIFSPRGIYMESSYPIFKEEKSTKVKIHPGAKTLLLDLPDVWLQSRQSDF